MIESEWPRMELVQTIITISTALVAAHNLSATEAAARAVEIIHEAVCAADVYLYDREKAGR